MAEHGLPQNELTFCRVQVRIHYFWEMAMGMINFEKKLSVLSFCFLCGCAWAMTSTSESGRSNLTSTVKASALRPSGESNIFHYHIENPEIALTNGRELVELVPANIHMDASVDKDGNAKVEMKLSARTKFGILEYELSTTGYEGVEFEADAKLDGKLVKTNVRIAKLDGCVLDVCPAAVRTDFLHEQIGLSVDVYSPAKKAK